jgi:ABC-type multidrug transport system fused ATPase/permease subunit
VWFIMRILFKLLFQQRIYKIFFALSVLTMCLLTLASTLEMVALGVITRKGPDFFELFAPMENGEKVRTEQITKKDVDTLWNKISKEEGGAITFEDASLYMTKNASEDRIQKIVNFSDSIIPITGHPRNLAAIILMVAIFKAIMLFSHRYLTTVLGIRISQTLRQKYFEHIQGMPLEFYDRYNIAVLSTRVIEDADLISKAINACLVNYLQTPFTALTTLLLCFLISWQLSLVVFLGFPLIVMPIIFLANRIKKVARQIQKNEERFTSLLLDYLGGIETVKIFGMEEFALKNYKEQNDNMAYWEKKKARYNLSSRPIVHTIAMAFLSMTLLYGFYVLNISIPEAFVFCGLLYLFYEPVKKFAEENGDILLGITASERMHEILDIKPVIQDKENALHIDSFIDKIEFDNVSFGYGNKEVLKNFSFTVNKGETVAIVGPTGAGKSTIVQLLPRLYEAKSGDIRIDGVSIKDFAQTSLRELIAFVPQKPFLFMDTINANISFGRRFPEDQVIAAAKKAHAHEFIDQLPCNYKTHLTERGNNLSGGQQQRIAIARALLKNSPILVMDEATSALDNVSEHHIKTAIRELHGSVTQIIIAHRLSTIEDADRIIYVEEGRKIAEGTKEDLLRTCPSFCHMWNLMQYKPTAKPELTASFN